MAPTAQPLRTERIHEANVRYHDAAAETYDSKWAIDYGEIGAGQVLGKLAKALGRPPAHYPRSLEIGAGTGYFTINLALQGLDGRVLEPRLPASLFYNLLVSARKPS